MKRLLLFFATACLLCAPQAKADNGRSVFMVITNSKGGQLAKVELDNKDDFKGPLLDRTKGTLSFKGRTYPIRQIGEIYFTYGTKTGINDVKAGVGKAVPSGVYNLQGVRVADKLEPTLPKGIYIVNGRKVVVK